MIKNYIVFDLEWSITTDEITCAAFIDDSGNERVIHSSEVGGERALIYLCKSMLDQYPISVGFFSKGVDPESDLMHIHKRSIYHGINLGFETSKLSFDKKKLASDPIPNKIHIDLHDIFDKLVVKNYIYKKKYKDMRLDSIAKALLGRGKIGEGKNVGSMTVAQIKEYCLADAKLTYDLTRVGQLDKKTNRPKLDNGLIELMQALATKTGLPLQAVCTYGMGSIWRAILRAKNAPESDPIHRPVPYAPKRTGPFIMDPIVGNYVDVAVLDVASLYPTIVANHNVSPEVTCCSCCKDDPTARVPGREGDLWTCKKRRGVVSDLFVDMRAERLDHKRKGNKVMADGLKIVLNAKTGLYNNAYYEYADVRCYDTIICYEKYYIHKIIDYAESIGLMLIYSDTDSLFIVYDQSVEGYHQCAKCGFGHFSAAIQAVIEYTKSLGVELEHEKTYAKLLITYKKHYIGIKDGEIVVAGMEGEKNDRPKWVNQTFKQFTNDFRDGVDPVPNLKTAWKNFEDGKVPMEDLKFRVKLEQDTYEGNTMQAQLSQLANSKAGDVVAFFKTHNGFSLDAKFSDLEKSDYRDIFESSFEPALSLLGVQISRVTEGYSISPLEAYFAA